jgi:hypothetical protein
MPPKRNFQRCITHFGQRLAINESYAWMHKNNCPVIEKNAVGLVVGTCTFYCKNGVCPRHGEWAKNAEVIHAN